MSVSQSVNNNNNNDISYPENRLAWSIIRLAKHCPKHLLYTYHTEKNVV